MTCCPQTQQRIHNIGHAHLRSSLYPLLIHTIMHSAPTSSPHPSPDSIVKSFLSMNSFHYKNILIMKFLTALLATILTASICAANFFSSSEKAAAYMVAGSYYEEGGEVSSGTIHRNQMRTFQLGNYSYSTERLEFYGGDCDGHKLKVST